jgi:type II secretory pathway component PulF
MMTQSKVVKKEKTSLFEAHVSFGGVSFTEKALFAKHLSIMLKSGLTLNESLNIIEDGAQGKFKKVLKKIGESINSGRSLSDSMKVFPKVFSSLFVSATYAGESSGTLTGNLEEVAKQLEKERELYSKIKGAMVYPIVVLVAAFILGLFLSFVILPKIVPLFEGLRVELPFSTRALIWFAHLLENYGAIILISIISFIIFIFWIVKRKFIKPLTHKLILGIPIIKNIAVNINLARFCRTLGTLLKSGLTINESIDVVKNSLNNYYYKKALAEVGKNIQKGNTLSSELKHNGELFPLVVSRMIQVGEESGNLSETLVYLADFYEIEVDSASKKLQTSIEPVLLIFIGLVVGFMAISIITPIYDITGNIQR